jgi:hypothetical protein
MFKKMLLATTMLTGLLTAPPVVAGQGDIPLLFHDNAAAFAIGKFGAASISFLLDTGAMQTNISDADAARIGIKLTPDFVQKWVDMLDANGGHKSVPIVNLGSLTVGGYTFRHVPVSVGGPLSLLGFDLIRHFPNARLDQPNQRLVVDDPVPADYCPSGDDTATHGTLCVRPTAVASAPVSAPPTYTPPPTYLPSAPGNTATTAFNAGRSDRLAFENWVQDLTGETKNGALYWASVRSTKEAATGCFGPGYTGLLDQRDWANGCTTANPHFSKGEGASGPWI